MLQSLTKAESDLIDQVRRSMERAQLVSYASYLGQPGFELHPAEIEMTPFLFRKGWITFALDLSLENGSAIWLTEEAWDLFGLEEWSELEEEQSHKNRPAAWGSWS